LQRQDQPPVVPYAKHHIGARDLLHPPPLALDDEHIVDADRLGHRDLQPGEQIAQHRARGETHHQPGDARRRQQTGADLPHIGNAHERHGQPDEQNQEAQHTGEHPRPGEQATHGEVGVEKLGIVGQLQTAASQHHEIAARAYQPHGQPGQGGDQQQLQRLDRPGHAAQVWRQQRRIDP